MHFSPRRREERRCSTACKIHNKYCLLLLINERDHYCKSASTTISTRFRIRFNHTHNYLHTDYSRTYTSLERSHVTIAREPMYRKLLYIQSHVFAKKKRKKTQFTEDRRNRRPEKERHFRVRPSLSLLSLFPSSFLFLFVSREIVHARVSTTVPIALY